jgi:hypothetical protein
MVLIAARGRGVDGAVDRDRRVEAVRRSVVRE